MRRKRRVEPKPYDAIPYGEPLPNKSMTIVNNTSHDLAFYQTGSTWETVNFAIQNDTTPPEDWLKGRELAILGPCDKMELTFHPPKQIEP